MRIAKPGSTYCLYIQSFARIFDQLCCIGCEPEEECAGNNQGGKDNASCNNGEPAVLRSEKEVCDQESATGEQQRKQHILIERLHTKLAPQEFEPYKVVNRERDQIAEGCSDDAILLYKNIAQRDPEGKHYNTTYKFEFPEV